MADHIVHYFAGQKGVQLLVATLNDKLEFFNVSDRLYEFNETAGTLTPVSIQRLRELIDEHLCDTHLVQISGKWVREYHRLQVTRQDLIDLMAELLKVAPIGPAETRPLSLAQQDWVIQRLNQGEQPASIARDYKLSVEQVTALR
jgi:hypothetical protein